MSLGFRLPAGRRLRRVAGAGLAAYMAAIFALSHMPQPPVPKALSSVSDKVLHAAEYLPLGLLWCTLLGPAGLRGAVLGWSAATAYGAGDEYHQSFVPGRDPSLGDLAADSIGAALGAVTALRLRRRETARPNPEA